MTTTKPKRQLGKALAGLSTRPTPPAHPEASTNSAPSTVVTPSRGVSPRYQDLEAKTARLHPGQMDDLDRLAKQITDQEKKAGRKPQHRITGNTLIRVAVDALLANQRKLAGGTEGELLRSLTN